MNISAMLYLFPDTSWQQHAAEIKYKEYRSDNSIAFWKEKDLDSGITKMQLVSTLDA